ncbi:MAG TPA: KH domain-containing protein [Actinomycetota bacterium]
MAETQGSPQDGEDVVSGTLAYLARALVEHPEDVRVETSPGERGTIYKLHVHPDDMGRVIGRGGRIARAIRQVTRAAAARVGTGAFIEIGD